MELGRERHHHVLAALDALDRLAQQADARAADLLVGERLGQLARQLLVGVRVGQQRGVDQDAGHGQHRHAGVCGKPVGLDDQRRPRFAKVALQGNMDPSMLYAPPARIEEEVATILAGFGQGEGHVFNLGHGIHQDVDPEHAGVFVEAVHRLSAPYHR